MIGIFRGLTRMVGFVLRLRVLRPLLVLAALVWAFDSLVTLATDAAWFSSVNLAAFWRTQLLWQTGLCAAFVLFCLPASIALMRAVARPVASQAHELPLPRALERWQPLRAKSLRLGWLALVGAAVVIGHDIGARWSEFALWSANGWAENTIDFWTIDAPILSLLLASLWKFALVAGLVALVAGALRALPFLAARPSVRPVRWIRALALLGGSLLLLRALGYVFEAAWHAQGAAENAFSRSLFLILCGAGALGCVALLPFLRRPRPILALWVLPVLLLPALGGDLVSPFAGRGNSTPQLPAPLLLPEQSPSVLPLGDEATLLRMARLHLGRNKERRLISWENAALSTSRDGRTIRADIVGAPLISDAWLGHGMVDEGGDLTWKSLDLPEFFASRTQPLGPLFFGPNARPLISEEKGKAQPGVPVESWMQKLAWSWRLRDPFLILDGEHAQRLLVWRGAQELGHKLAPFWTWDAAVPRRDPQTGAAYFECVAYSSTNGFPRRAPLRSGPFAGQNAVFPVAVLRLDCRLGEVRLAPFSGSDAARWQKAIPLLFTKTQAQQAPTTALQTSLSNGWPLLWTRASATQDWQRVAIPLEYQARVRKKLLAFASDPRARSLDGATPILWRQDKILWLAQPFFSARGAKEQASTSPTNDLPIRVAGVAFGSLEDPVTGWGSTLGEARANLDAVTAPTALAAESPTPIPTSINGSLRELAQAALESQRTASRALREGRYVESQRANERASALLQQLERQAR